jgi:hypothetical protein
MAKPVMAAVGGAGAPSTKPPAAVGGNGANAGAAGMPAAGSGGAAAMPMMRDGKLALDLGAITFEIDPAMGGRITRFSLDGTNILTDASVDATNWGSTFWPSPQARWDWPPVPELDTQPYMANVTGDAIELVSQPGMRAKVRVTKRVRALASEEAIELTYVLENTDTANASWAPWEISRVAPGGLTFFPSAGAAVNAQLPVMNQNGATWFKHDPANIPMSGQKFSADGSGGWIAHVAGRTLFLKRFTDTPADKQAPSPEAEVELYASPAYEEIEPQGPYTQLAPGESVTWTVRWYLRALPDSIPVELGNAALFQFAQTLANQ